MRIKKVLLPLASLAVLSSLSLTSCKKNTPEIDLSEGATLVDVTVLATGAKTTFALGEEFDANGLKVVAAYSNNAKIDLKSDAYVVDSSEYKANVAGEYTIHVNYTKGTIKKSAAYTVKVESIAKKQSVYLKGITVEGVKTNYIAGESKNVVEESFKAIAHYSDNSEKDVTANVKKDYEAFDGNKIGVYQLNYSYSEDYEFNGQKETRTSNTFEIATVDAYIDKIEFVSGSTTVDQNTVGPDGSLGSIDMSDWVVEASFLDNGFALMSQKVQISPDKLVLTKFNSAVSGKQTATISYTHPGESQATTCDVEITVNPVRDADYTFVTGNLTQENFAAPAGDTAIDDKGIVFLTEKCQVKSDSGKKFGLWTSDDFKKRMQTNGAGSPSKNSIKVVLKEKATIGIVGADGEKGATNIGFYDENGKAVTELNESFVKNQPSYYKYELEAGTYYFYGTAAVRVYAIQIWYGSMK
ncbi:MAG: bacterial Ig-like domain-containing protein [Acholeplasmatales bacterium]|nr:bacterial Ig-like domain-containing protein [Acholeplasmatales bacterium]